MVSDGQKKYGGKGGNRRGPRARDDAGVSMTLSLDSEGSLPRAGAATAPPTRARASPSFGSPRRGRRTVRHRYGRKSAKDT